MSIRRMLIMMLLASTPAAQAPAAAAPVADLAITGARVYTAPDAAPIEQGIVRVRGGRIERVGPAGTVPIPRGLRVIDARGSVLTAGFWNSHIHVMPPELLGADKASPAALEQALCAMLTKWGFTTVFDIASSTDNTLALRRRIESGELAGPLILTVGAPFYPQGGTPVYVREYFKAHALPSMEVADAAEAASRARAQLAQGTDGVKIFAGAIVGGQTGVLPMPVDVATAAVAEAHRRGRPAFAHPSNLAGIRVAMASGVDILAHTTAMDGPWSPELIAALRARNIALIPTLTLFAVEARKLGDSPGELAREIRTTAAQVRDYSAAGGQILFGTDVGYTDAVDTTQEYRLLAAALDWRQILASLTTAPAERFGFAKAKGRIAPGLDADLVLLESDPAGDATAFARVRDTIRAGRILWGRDR